MLLCSKGNEALCGVVTLTTVTSHTHRCELILNMALKHVFQLRLKKQNVNPALKMKPANPDLI